MASCSQKASTSEIHPKAQPKKSKRKRDAGKSSDGKPSKKIRFDDSLGDVARHCEPLVTLGATSTPLEVFYT